MPLFLYVLSQQSLYLCRGITLILELTSSYSKVRHLQRILIMWIWMQPVENVLVYIICGLTSGIQNPSSFFLRGYLQAIITAWLMVQLCCASSSWQQQKMPGGLVTWTLSTWLRGDSHNTLSNPVIRGSLITSTSDVLKLVYRLGETDGGRKGRHTATLDWHLRREVSKWQTGVLSLHFLLGELELIAVLWYTVSLVVGV